MYSRNHTTYNPNTDKAFWDFSIDEFAVDFKANVEYVSNFVGKKRNILQCSKQYKDCSSTKFAKISVVAHSLGTAQSFIATSTEPEWFDERISILVALAPVSRSNHCVNDPNPNALVTKLMYFVFRLIRGFILGEIWGENSIITSITYPIWYYIPSLWNYALILFSDSTPSVNEISSIKTFLSHYPTGSSFRILQHLTQLARTCEFESFDYGAAKNRFIYGTDSPKIYNLTNITIPVALYVGEYDTLSTPESVVWLTQQLRNETLVKYELYPLGHVGFFVAKNMSYMEDANKLIQLYN